jgi:hypothetical protein
LRRGTSGDEPRSGSGYAAVVARRIQPVAQRFVFVVVVVSLLPLLSLVCDFSFIDFPLLSIVRCVSVLVLLASLSEGLEGFGFVVVVVLFSVLFSVLCAIDTPVISASAMALANRVFNIGRSPLR